MRHVLLIDDDAAMLEVSGRYLERAGFVVTRSSDGMHGLRLALESTPAVVVLDVNLPGLNGFAVLERLRDQTVTKVLMLSARGEEADRLRGLEGGADDYLLKPFSPRELVARVKILAGRTEGLGRSLTFGALKIEVDNRRVLLGGDALNLTALEFELLSVLANRPGQLWERNQLLAKVWGESFAGVDRVVDVHISSLRRKLGAAARHIQTVRGAGYRFKDAL